MKSRIIRKPNGTVVKAFYDAKSMCFCDVCCEVVRKSEATKADLLITKSVAKSVTIGPCCKQDVARRNEAVDPIDPVEDADVREPGFIPMDMVVDAETADPFDPVELEDKEAEREILMELVVQAESEDSLDPATDADVCTLHLIKMEMTAHAKFVDQLKAA